jgi:hypothetical protein
MYSTKIQSLAEQHGGLEKLLASIVVLVGQNKQA